ncbi:hypothetical protein [Legionella geestiana]|nr:hypothetical protein [Legionella geestiana]
MQRLNPVIAPDGKKTGIPQSEYEGTTGKKATAGIIIAGKQLSNAAFAL